MLFTFPNIHIIYNKEMPVNGAVTIEVSNHTAFVFVKGKHLFSFYPKGLSFNELKTLLKENFLEDGVTINDSELEDICSKVSSFI